MQKSILTVLTAVLCFVFLAPNTLAAQKRPNILFAFADDWGKHASAYAKIEPNDSPNHIINTPNFDRVAAQGVLFKNAFVTSPSCTPCRSSLLSGQYFFRTRRGAILQGAVWDPNIPSFPLLLRDAGYHIGQTYKVWSPGTPNDAPYGGTEYAYDSAGRRFNGFSQNVTTMVSQGKSVADAKQVLYDEVMGNFESFLDDREDGEPFCYWFGPTLVHRKWIQGSGKKLWGINPDDLKGRVPPFMPDEHIIREDLADYFGEIQAFDHALGLLLERLEAMGELDNTLIVVSGDHGAPGFSNGKCNLYDFGVNVPLAIRWGNRRGRVVDDFVNLMDLAPTFLEAGGVDIPDVMTGKSLVNVVNSTKGGLVDPSRTWVITGRERHVAKARAGNIGYPQRAYRNRDHLYIINFKPDRWPMGDPYNLDGDDEPTIDKLTNNTFVTFGDYDASPTKAFLVANRNKPELVKFYEFAFGKRPREELFILSDDPHQINNVANDPAYADLKAELNRKLMNELKRVGDPRVTGDGSTFDKPPFTD